jgi:hypothetical protein
VVLALLVASNREVVKKSNKRPWKILLKQGATPLRHYVLNLTLDAPGQILPMLVIILLSTAASAWFYISSMLASFIYAVLTALTTVLYATSSAQPDVLFRKIRLTLGLSIAVCVSANVLFLLGAGYLLTLFGRSYAEQAVWCLHIQALGAFPCIIRTHYIAIHRIRGSVTRAVFPMLACGILELSCAALGARFTGLTGLSLGLLAAFCFEGLCMARTVYQFARPGMPSVLIEPGHSAALTTTQS